MAVKIVTDSCADVTKEEAQKHKITVIPAYLRFGDQVYRDGVDIDRDEFYHKLVEAMTSWAHSSCRSDYDYLQ